MLSAFLALSFASVLNPEVHQGNIHQTICVTGWTKHIRPDVGYTNKIKFEKMRALGIDLSEKAAYQLDHVVPLSLGGCAACLENLQLIPLRGERGAHKKDGRSRHYRHRVCRGTMTLAEAQQNVWRDGRYGDHRRHSGCSATVPAPVTGKQ